MVHCTLALRLCTAGKARARAAAGCLCWITQRGLPCAGTVSLRLQSSSRGSQLREASGDTMDSWEDEEDTGEKIVLPKTALNINAPSFSFNPGASSWAPPGQSQPAAPVSQPAPPAQSSPAAEPSHAEDAPAAPTPPAAADTDMAEPDQHQAHEQQHDDDATMRDGDDSSAAVQSATEQLDDMAVDDRPSALTPPVLDSPASDTPQPAQPPPTPAPVGDTALPASQADGSELTSEQQSVVTALAEMDSREHVNVVFIGHVDAGKSTIGGQILFLTGGVDERTIQKYEREAKEKNRESWYMAYIMDTNEEERAKGKTVEVGRALFETEKKRYTILDAPGHKNYVPNMIGGAALADVGVLVISARKAEFEAGFERGGQTREHAQLAKTLGVTKIIVAVNKMDEPSIAGPDGEWSEARFKEIQEKLTQFLKMCGYHPKKDIAYVPISGLYGDNIKNPVDHDKICPWYTGPTLFEQLDSTDVPPRDPLAPFRMAVIDKFKDLGTVVMGKSESGAVRKGDTLLLMPNRTKVQVQTIFCDETEVGAAKGGENLRLRLSGIDEDDVQAGFVVCDPHVVVPVVTYFEAQLQILELLEHTPIFSAGYKCILHIHSVVEECECTEMRYELDPKTKSKKKVKFVKSNKAAVVRLAVEKPICVELFSSVPQLGRFTLRDEGRTIAIGKIIKLPSGKKSVGDNAFSAT